MNIEEFKYEDVKIAIDGSSSIKEFLLNLGLKVNNGNYRRAAQIAKYNGLTLNKHDPTKNGSVLTQYNRIPNEEFFVKGVLRAGPSIRKRLISMGIEDMCVICGQGPFWNGKPMVLTVDHIDGDRFNNELSNLRILCWNCHSQTDTYSNKRGSKIYNYCPCGCRIAKTRKYCAECIPDPSINLKRGSDIIIDYPPIDVIIKTVQDSGGWSSCERILGIGQNSIRKHLLRNGVDPKSVKYIRRSRGDLKQVAN